ncbi:MAG: sulfur carrier protein ThiS [Gemmatimonadales bacterium]
MNAAIAALPRLHAITDDRVIARGDVLARAETLARTAGSALAVHVRSRALPGGPLLKLAGELRDLIGPFGAWLVVNDRADVARITRARALVSGRGGLGVADARKAAPHALIARSVHDGAEVRVALAESADFLVAGSVFATASHPERAAAGIGLVSEAAGGAAPVIAIGGVTPERTAEVIAAGAWGVAAIRALWDADDPAAAARAFLSALPAGDTYGVVVNGEEQRVRRGITLAGLLSDLSLDPREVVVEHNRRIVRRDALATTGVGEGDKVELVHFVGGG